MALEESLDGVDRPQVFLLSSGEATPFCVAVESREQRVWQVCAQADGEIAVTAPGVAG